MILPSNKMSFSDISFMQLGNRNSYYRYEFSLYM